MILQNAVQILHKGKHVTYLKSAHVHDWQSFNFNEKDFYFVDGGNEYIRRGGNIPQDYQVIELNLDIDSSFEDCCEQMLWGSRGPSGNEPLKYVLLNQCDADYLMNIWRYLLAFIEKLDTRTRIRTFCKISVIAHLLAKKMSEAR